MAGLIALIPLCPLVGFAVLACFGRALGKSGSAFLGVGSVAAAALLSAVVAWRYWPMPDQAYRLTLASWFQAANLSVQYGFYLDRLAFNLILIVTGIGFLIHLYSVEFMRDDPDFSRFFAYMNLFVAAMLLLVLADNLVLLFLGWEGVGLGSYLLIGFWYREPANGRAARKAFLMTRIGDTAFAVGLFLLFYHLHTLDIPTLLDRAVELWPVGGGAPMWAAALLLGGAVGKSAQLPLQTWLPDAMAGPTPVSALLHAATMVTAGVYLIARMHDLFLLAPAVHYAVACIGAATLIMAACSALAQTDLKRILAYSTMSQIGYMFLAMGVGAWSAGIFHLLTHAFFKALLFLAAGAVIQCVHEYDIFNMGGLRKSLPLAFLSFVVGASALAALPFTSGFYSKHDILSAAYARSPGLWAWASLGAALTGLYSFRLVFVVFFGAAKNPVHKTYGPLTAFPLMVFTLLALGGGLLKNPVFAGDAEATAPLWVNLISIAAPLVGAALAALIYLTGSIPQPELPRLRQFWLRGWDFDRLYQRLVAKPYGYLAHLNRADIVDRLYTAVAQGALLLHDWSSRTQTGQLRWYAASLAAGVILVLAIGLGI